MTAIAAYSFQRRRRRPSRLRLPGAVAGVSDFVVGKRVPFGSEINPRGFRLQPEEQRRPGIFRLKAEAWEH
jgi:hypothetical protein